jgi:RNA polymerase sigma-70 factor (ECF subfamily)
VGWDEFVSRYRPKIFAWCRRWGLQEPDADDVTQNVLVKLTEKMRSFRYDPAQSFRRWLRTVTHNTCIDYADRWHKQRGSGNTEVLKLLQSVEAHSELAAQLEATFDQELLSLALERVRQRVEPKTWDAFRLTVQEGATAAVAGRRIDMPVAHVFVAKHRVQKMLEREIRAMEAPEDATSDTPDR